MLPALFRAAAAAGAGVAASPGAAAAAAAVPLPWTRCAAAAAAAVAAAGRARGAAAPAAVASACGARGVHSAPAAATGAAKYPAATPLTVGFIGVGNMGGPMAAALLKAGHRVLVYDRNPAAVGKLEAMGAKAAGSPKEMGETPGVAAVISMLPSTEHVQDAYEGPQGVLRASALQPPLLIDSSTISPLYTRELAERVTSLSLAPQPPRPDMPWASAPGAPPRVIDAPVSGGVLAAKNASLTFMVGGPNDAVAAARPLLGAMGTHVMHLGGPGMGQAAKICNNLCLAVQMAGVSEALALGAGLGLDPRLLSEVMDEGSASCWALHSYNPAPGVMEDVPASRDYSGGFSAQLMLKDLRLAMELAAATQTPTPMTQDVARLYRAVVDATAHAPSPVDFSAVYKYVHSVPRMTSE